jgi:hypothetical protein
MIIMIALPIDMIRFFVPAGKNPVSPLVLFGAARQEPRMSPGKPDGVFRLF